MTGRTISHYQILDKLGEGGMGVVYKARDSHLDRFVAIKVLPPEKVADPERKRRFVQEAKAASALKHPNIITVYDIDESGGLHFIVMELVDGESLDRLLQRQRLRLDQVLNYAVQIADALGAAHGAGIIHRDLKPANVMVTIKGWVKLVDFGVAKLVEEPASYEEQATRTVSPATERGMIFGTAPYMSPEQAEGKPVDARSDIFSFGALLYEMLTGKRAFEGATQRSLLTAIMTRDPPSVSGTEASFPRALDRALRRCLAKEPDNRWQSAADLSDELRWIAESLQPETSAGASARKFWLWRWSLTGALMIAAIAILAIWMHAPRLSHELPLRRFELAAGQRPVDVAISPDGRRIVYQVGPEGHSSIWVRDLDQDEPREIVALGSNSSPFWSPDSESIGFFAETLLKRVSVHGGDAVTVCPLPSDVIGGGTWSRDGQSIVFSAGTPTRVHEVEVQGGAPKLLVHAGPSEVNRNFVDPHFLPTDSGRPVLLFAVGGASQPYQIVLQDLTTGKRVLLGPGRRPVFSPTGHIIYEDRQRLWALPFSTEALAARGTAVPDPAGRRVPRCLGRQHAHLHRRARRGSGAAGVERP